MTGRYELVKDCARQGADDRHRIRRAAVVQAQGVVELLEAANSGLFCQLITIPLFKEHQILTQVAGHAQPHHQAIAAADHLGRRTATWIEESFEAAIAEAHRVPARHRHSARRWPITRSRRAPWRQRADFRKAT